MRPPSPPIHDAGRARLLPRRDQTGSFGSAGASPYRVNMKMPGHKPSFLLASAATDRSGFKRIVRKGG